MAELWGDYKIRRRDWKRKFAWFPVKSFYGGKWMWMRYVEYAEWYTHLMSGHDYRLCRKKEWFDG